MAPTKKKRSYEWKDLYADEYGLKVVARNATTSRVETVSYRFCITFGREESIDACDDVAEEEKSDNNDIGLPINTNNVDAINEVVDGGDNKRKRRKHTANHKQWTGPKFRTDYFTKHLQQQHAKRWEKYNQLRQSYIQEVNSSPNSSVLETPFANRFKKFFRTTFMPAYFEADRSGKQRAAINIGKNIVETVVLGLLFDVDADDGSSASRARTIFEEVHNSDGEPVSSYNIRINNFDQLRYVQRLLGCGLSFVQCAKVVSASREELGQAAKIGCASENDVARIARITCALSLEMLSEMMRASWAYSVGLDASTDSFGVSMLDLRIRILVNGDIHNFHMLTVPMFAEHSGEEMFKLLSDSLSALDPDWKMKIVGITTDGAASMTGVRKGIVSRIQAVAAKGLIRVWCGAHQLDLALKKALGRLPEAFLTTLTTMIAYLRRQQKLISEMKSKSPYYITVRWSSLCQVVSWYVKHREKVKAFLAEKEVVWAPSEQWWLTLLMLHKMLDLFWSTSASLQASNLTLRQQTSNLSSLVTELKTSVGATHETSTSPDPASDALVEEEHNSSPFLIRYGPFTLLRDQAERHIKGTNLLTMSMANRLPADDLEEVTRDVSRVYVQAMYSVAAIVAERDARNREKTDAAPPVLPLEIAGLSIIEFTELLFEHEERLRHSFPGTVVEEVISKEFEQLVRLISRDSNLKATLTKGSEDSDFGKAWRPLGNRFPYMLRFAAGLASVMPGTATVEADFSTINYEKDDHRSALTNFSLEGILHSRQLEKLRQTFNEMALQERN